MADGAFRINTDTDDDSDGDPQNTNTSANVDNSPASIVQPETYSCFGFYERPMTAPPAGAPPPQLQATNNLLPVSSHLQYIGTMGPGVAPLPYLHFTAPGGPPPPPGVQFAMPSGGNFMEFCGGPGVIGTAPGTGIPGIPVGSTGMDPMYSYSSTSSYTMATQSNCLPPMFFPSETSFQMSSSPCSSDVNLTASQITLTGCPSLMFSHPPPLPSLNNQVASTSAAGGATSSVLYPVVYVSPAGLLTVLMREDVAVEMTLDRAIRVVNHAHKAVVATNGRGNASCIYHVAAKIYQDRTSTQCELFGDRRAKMTTEVMEFGTVYGPAGSSSATCYRLTEFGLKANSTPDFSDLSQDMSVTLLFSSSGYGPHLIAQYEEVAQASRYRFYRNGAVTVYINGVRVHQTARGDVVVGSGRKYMRVSPRTGLARVVTHFVEMTVEQNWTVRVRRGGHRLLANANVFLLANDKLEFGYDQFKRPFLQPLSERQETIICRLGGGRKALLGPQSSDSRLLSQCMAAAGSYSATDWQQQQQQQVVPGRQQQQQQQPVGHCTDLNRPPSMSDFPPLSVNLYSPFCSVPFGSDVESKQQQATDRSAVGNTQRTQLTH